MGTIGGRPALDVVREIEAVGSADPPRKKVPFEEAMDVAFPERQERRERLRKQRRNPELLIQRDIVRQLRVFVPEAMIHHGDSGARLPEERRRKAELGAHPGWPDLQILFPGGKAVFLEVKSPSGKLTEKQAETLARLREMGFAAASFNRADKAVEWVRKQR